MAKAGNAGDQGAQATGKNGGGLSQAELKEALEVPAEEKAELDSSSRSLRKTCRTIQCRWTPFGFINHGATSASGLASCLDFASARAF